MKTFFHARRVKPAGMTARRIKRRRHRSIRQGDLNRRVRTRMPGGVGGGRP